MLQASSMSSNALSFFIFLETQATLFYRVVPVEMKTDSSSEQTETVFEILLAEAVLYVDEIEKIYPVSNSNSNLESTSFVIEWKPTSTLSKRGKHGAIFFLKKKNETVKENLSCREYSELEETIGCMMNLYKQRRILQINRLKELWKLKCISYEKTDVEHQNKLKKLWELVFPNDPTVDFVGKKWRKLGFQSLYLQSNRNCFVVNDQTFLI